MDAGEHEARVCAHMLQVTVATPAVPLCMQRSSCFGFACAHASDAWIAFHSLIEAPSPAVLFHSCSRSAGGLLCALRTFGAHARSSITSSATQTSPMATQYIETSGLQFARPRDTEATSRYLFLGNVDPQRHIPQLESVFHSFASLKTIYIPQDSSRQFCFAEFNTAEDAAHVLASLGHGSLTLEGRKVTIRYSDAIVSWGWGSRE